MTSIPFFQGPRFKRPIFQIGFLHAKHQLYKLPCLTCDLFFLLSSTFCLTDKDSKCLAVNLYNLAPGKGVIIGDTVAIAEPNFSHVSLHIKEQVTFPSAVISIIPLKLFVFLFNLSAHCI